MSAELVVKLRNAPVRHGELRKEKSWARDIRGKKRLCGDDQHVAQHRIRRRPRRVVWADHGVSADNERAGEDKGDPKHVMRAQVALEEDPRDERGENHNGTAPDPR